MHFFQKKYPLWSTILVGLLIGAGSAAFFYRANAHMRTQLADQQHQQIQQQATYITELERLAQADELSLQAQYAQARTLYEQLAADTTSVLHQTAQARLKLLESTSDKNTSTIRLVAHTPENNGPNPPELEVELALKNKALDSLLEIKSILDLQLNAAQSNRDTIRFSQRSIRFASSKGTMLDYAGETQNGQANGYGIGVWESGSIYNGKWKNNQRHGRGEFQWKDGTRYKGAYENDMRQGYGVYYWNNGERYEGYWEDDKRNGEGTIYRKNGRVVMTGVWKDDRLVEKK
ncbi:hypothetical protein GCM10027275_09550 [Rhabdobacter roseus]|uniref:MORN repeat protein n=1 Tax=Rhabdobacter roseus TaxID=1655419 RepID=A0A840TFF8_9BACT|nr:hypothetical protein [Rhabdobacter roseus]MBB5282856.1 hypothetical protein [Rhabdobacter roseus]